MYRPCLRSPAQGVVTALGARALGAREMEKRGITLGRSRLLGWFRWKDQEIPSPSRLC